MKKEKTRLEKDINIITDRAIQIDMLAIALSNFKNNFHTLTIQEKRTLIKLMVKKII